MAMLKRILLIDDDDSILEIMQEILCYEGYEVKAINKTDNIITCIKDVKPDVVLLDYLLSGINGGELCAQIKKNSQTAHLPVIILSAYSRVLLSLGNYGCDEFIAKPFDISDVLSAISHAIYKSPPHNDIYIQ
jgi:CheY-like chemotaxis protein